MQKAISELKQTSVEEMQDELMSSISVEGTTVDASGLHAELDRTADDMSVEGFKCPTCNLAHMHGTTKHRATDTFDLSDDEAASMEYNSVCHCGVNELARRGGEFGIDVARAASIASNAPIPDATTQEMNAKFN